MMQEDFLWTEKWRPKTIDECILPERLKKTFKEFVKKGTFQNLLLSGTAGIGKTTVIKAMCNELDADVMIINGSMNGNIDTLRNDIQRFASAVSLSGGRKVCILDEADGLNPQSFQPALRNFMEELSKNCAFALTCNFKNKIIEPLHSRCTSIEMRIDKKDLPKLAGQFLKRVQHILETENIEYDTKVVAEVIMKYLPDWRRVLNELQRYSVTGKIDSGVLSSFSDDSFKSLIEQMKVKSFTNVRKWVTENSDIESTALYRNFYDNAVQFLEPSSIPYLVVLIAKYQYQEAFCADREVNLAAFCAELMSDCSFR